MSDDGTTQVRDAPFGLRRPCAECPFRTNRPGFLSRTRAAEIAADVIGYGKPFLCHKTVEYDGSEDDQEPGGLSQYCVGAMLLCVAEGRPHQGMQLGERLLGWHASQLEEAAPVVQNVEAFLDHHDPDGQGPATDPRRPWRSKENIDAT